MTMTPELDNYRDNLLEKVDGILTSAREPMPPGGREALLVVRKVIETTTAARGRNAGHATIRIPMPGVVIHPWAHLDPERPAEFHPGGMRLDWMVTKERQLCVTATAFQRACHCGVLLFQY